MLRKMSKRRGNYAQMITTNGPEDSVLIIKNWGIESNCWPE
jgi:hypothetical protein